MRRGMPCSICWKFRCLVVRKDRKSTRLNSSHTVIYTLSLHDALPIFTRENVITGTWVAVLLHETGHALFDMLEVPVFGREERSEEHTSELQSHRDLHSFPTRRSSDLHA